MRVEFVSIKRRILSSQDQVSKYLWRGSYRSVLGWICSKQVLFGVISKSASRNSNFSMIESFFSEFSLRKLELSSGAECRLS